jgi:hypothetical protein
LVVIPQRSAVAFAVAFAFAVAIVFWLSSFAAGGGPAFAFAFAVAFCFWLFIPRRTHSAKGATL